MFKQVWIKTVISLIFFAASLAACSTNAVNKETAIENRLANISGEYVWNNQENGYFYNKKTELNRILSEESTEKTLPLLVQCMDNPSPSNSTLAGQPVSVGILCYEALTLLVYHEPVDAEGDIALNWPGYLTLPASTENISDAKKAWQKVVQDRTYILQ